jgi:hypothetical protein
LKIRQKREFTSTKIAIEEPNREEYEEKYGYIPKRRNRNTID